MAPPVAADAIALEGIEGISSEEKALQLLENQEVTARTLSATLVSLEFANDRLQAAMYQMGFLEAKLEHLQALADEIPDLRARAHRLTLLEKENDELKLMLVERDVQLAECDFELNQAQQLINRVRTSWWCRLWSWLTETSLD